ncbi:hypothetical protein ACH5RR_033768 [Cinchona calisaya]|uniref:Uncharacterized protein n=1 Tax=Cinchona calisaya TaxID=153742 RepID=A0ABD2YDJ0_9GENT
MAGYRPIFGVDGCFLKSDSGGILLIAVGIDPNNCLFSFVIAIIEGETKDSCNWSLAGYKGKTLRDALCAAAKATTLEAFRKKMTKIATIDEDAANHLRNGIGLILAPFRNVTHC